MLITQYLFHGQLQSKFINWKNLRIYLSTMIDRKREKHGKVKQRGEEMIWMDYHPFNYIYD
jgi:hypothetical protein